MNNLQQLVALKKAALSGTYSPILDKSERKNISRASSTKEILDTLGLVEKQEKEALVERFFQEIENYPKDT